MMASSKIKEIRTSMIDLFYDSSSLADPGKRSNTVKSVEKFLQSLFLTKKYETTFGDSQFAVFSNKEGSLSCVLKSYPYGLVTLTFEDSLTGEAAILNPELEDIQKQMFKELKVNRAERIPLLKRGTVVPVYFTTHDERILEYDFNKVVYDATSPYQNIRILHSPTLKNCLLLDNNQNLGECDLSYTRGIMKYGEISYTGKEILILGGGDGALLHELLKQNPKFVTVVDIDQMVIDACRQHLRGCCGDALDNLIGQNYHVIVDDCVKKLDEYKRNGRKFDVIFYDLTDIPIATSAQGEVWGFVRKIINKSMDVLKGDGYYLTHAQSEGCVEALKTYEDLLSSLPVKVTFKSHSAFVPSFLEKWVFYEIRKA